MYYKSSDFLETADSDTLKQIARTRELTREYYFSDYGDIEKRTSIFFRTYARPIEIENNVWIGGGCILLPGVTIGENSVIGAGSVVTRPVPPNCVAVGNPCRVIRYFDADRER